MASQGLSLGNDCFHCFSHTHYNAEVPFPVFLYYLPTVVLLTSSSYFRRLPMTYSARSEGIRLTPCTGSLKRLLPWQPPRRLRRLPPLDACTSRVSFGFFQTSRCMMVTVESPASARETAPPYLKECIENSVCSPAF